MAPGRGLLGRPRVRTVQPPILHGRVPVRQGVARLHLTRARVEFEFTYPDRRRRDRSNLAPTVKALMDGMIDAGLLPDDADRYLDGPHTVIADRPAARWIGVPMYEVRVCVYADEREDR